MDDAHARLLVGPTDPGPTPTRALKTIVPAMEEEDEDEDEVNGFMSTTYVQRERSLSFFPCSSPRLRCPISCGKGELMKERHGSASVMDIDPKIVNAYIDRLSH